MSAVEEAVEQVKRLDETRARQLLEWLRELKTDQPRSPQPQGAQAMIGYALRFNPERRTTAEWVADLREGERE